MTFDELAKELDELYTKRYLDREPALREFGTDHEPDLRQMLESGHSLPDLVECGADRYTRILGRLYSRGYGNCSLFKGSINPHHAGVETIRHKKRRGS